VDLIKILNGVTVEVMHYYDGKYYDGEYYDI
jgi:hypothetical protein